MSNQISQNKNIFLRYVMLLAGIFLMGSGISWIIKSGTGTSPMSSLTNVMTQVFPVLSLGTYTFFLNFSFFVGEFILEPKSFKLSKFIQLIPTFILSVAIDFNMMLVANLVPANYAIRIVVLIIGCMFFGLSIACMVSANILLMPTEAFIGIICDKTGKEFGTIKTYFDITLVILAVIVSFIFLRRVHGVREGTLIAALCIGNFTRFFKKYTNKIANIQFGLKETC